MQSSSVTRVWVVRHGEPENEARGRCYGRLDLGLSTFGRRQMIRVAGFLSEEPLKAVYCSPRRRALESARMVASVHDLRVEVVDDLCEIHFGDFEGKTYEEIEKQYPEVFRKWMEFPTEVHFPGGESFARMQERVLRSVESLYTRHAGDCFAIISHGGVNRIVLAAALNLMPANIFRLGQRYAALNLIYHHQDTPVVELMNWAATDSEAF